MATSERKKCKGCLRSFKNIFTTCDVCQSNVCKKCAVRPEGYDLVLTCGGLCAALIEEQDKAAAQAKAKEHCTNDSYYHLAMDAAFFLQIDLGMSEANSPLLKEPELTDRLNNREMTQADLIELITLGKAWGCTDFGSQSWDTKQKTEDLAVMGWKVCPSCDYVGDVAEDFGYRMMRGKQKAQSYCRECRSGKKTNKTKGTTNASKTTSNKKGQNRLQTRSNQRDSRRATSAQSKGLK